MPSKYLTVLAILFCAFSMACTTTEKTNANVTVNANVPPELSGNQITVDNKSIPGINPENANVVTRGATPIPGIPDEKNLGKPLPKGATPTPGIPDEKTLKEQSQKLSNTKSSASQSDSETRPANRQGINNKP